MLYRAAICDDEAQCASLIENYITEFSLKSDAEFRITKFSDGNALLECYKTERSPFYIVFLDMEMPGKSGLETAEEIRRIPDRNVLIVFITSFPDYMQDSFDVQAAQYLCKPVPYEMFEKKLKKILAYLDELETNITVITNKDGERVLHLSEIVCIEADRLHGVAITLRDGKIIAKQRLAEFEEALAGRGFVSVHRSCLANMRFVKRFGADEMEFSTGKTVRISRRKMPEVKEAFSRYTIARLKNE